MKSLINFYLREAKQRVKKQCHNSLLPPQKIYMGDALNKGRELIESGKAELQHGNDTKAWYQIEKGLYFLQTIFPANLSNAPSSKKQKFELMKRRAMLDFKKFNPLIIALTAKMSLTLQSIFNPIALESIIKDSVTDRESREKLNYVLDEVLLGPVLKKLKEAGCERDLFVKTKLRFLEAALLAINKVIEYPAEYTDLLHELGVDVEKATKSFNGKTFDEWKTFLSENPAEKLVDESIALNQEDIKRLLEVLPRIQGASIVTPPTIDVIETNNLSENTGDNTKSQTSSIEEVIDENNIDKKNGSPSPITPDQIKEAQVALKKFFTGIVEGKEQITDINSLVEQVLNSVGERNKAILKKLEIEKAVLITALYSLQAKQKGQVWELNLDTLSLPHSKDVKDKLLTGLETLDKLCGWDEKNPDTRIFITDITDKNINGTDEEVLSVYGKLIQNSENRRLTYKDFKSKLLKVLKNEGKIIGEKELELRFDKLKLTEKEYLIFIAYHEGHDLKEIDFTLKVLQATYPELMNVTPVEKSVQAQSNKLKIKAVAYPTIIHDYFKLAEKLGAEVNKDGLPDKGQIFQKYGRYPYHLIPEGMHRAYGSFIGGSSRAQEFTLIATLESNEEKPIKIKRQELPEYLRKFPISLKSK